MSGVLEERLFLEPTGEETPVPSGRVPIIEETPLPQAPREDTGSFTATQYLNYLNAGRFHEALTPSLYFLLGDVEISGHDFGIRLRGQIGNVHCTRIQPWDNLCVPVQSVTEYSTARLRSWLAYGFDRSRKRPPPADHPTVTAVKDLSNWLDISQTDAIALSGVPERTFYHWQRNPNVRPRVAETDRLSRLHALVELLVSEIGAEEARRWFRSGRPSHLDALKAEPTAIATVEAAGKQLVYSSIYGSLSRTLDNGFRPSEGGSNAEAIARAEVEFPDPVRSLMVPPGGRE